MNIKSSMKSIFSSTKCITPVKSPRIHPSFIPCSIKTHYHVNKNCPDQESVLQRINNYNNNILYLRFQIDEVTRSHNTHTGNYMDEARYFDELEEMYAELAKLKDHLRDVKTMSCVCMDDATIPRCCQYNV